MSLEKRASGKPREKRVHHDLTSDKEQWIDQGLCRGETMICTETDGDNATVRGSARYRGGGQPDCLGQHPNMERVKPIRVLIFGTLCRCGWIGPNGPTGRDQWSISLPATTFVIVVFCQVLSGRVGVYLQELLPSSLPFSPSIFSHTLVPTNGTSSPSLVPRIRAPATISGGRPR